MALKLVVDNTKQQTEQSDAHLPIGKLNGNINQSIKLRAEIEKLKEALEVTNYNTSSDRLDKLSLKSYPEVRAKIPNHKNTTQLTMYRLADDIDEYVRFNVIMSPYVKPLVLQYMLTKKENQKFRPTIEYKLARMTKEPMMIKGVLRVVVDNTRGKNQPTQ